MKKVLKKTMQLAWDNYHNAFDNKRCFHVSALFKNNQLLAFDTNDYKTHTRNRFNLTKFDVSLKSSCSELKVFLQAKNKLNNLNWKKLTMVNCRIDKNGIVKGSKPCDACQSLLLFLGIKNVYYTNENGEFEKYKL